MLASKRVVVTRHWQLGRFGCVWVDLRRDRVAPSWPWFEHWRQRGVHFLRLGRLEVTHAPARLVRSLRSGSASASGVENRHLPA